MSKERYHHGDLKKELIEKGIEIVNTKGLSCLTMRNVAANCDVSATAAYKHFKNKNELLDAIRMEIAKDFSDYLKQCLSGLTSKDAMLEIGKGYVKYLIDHREYYYFMFCSELNLKVTFQKGEFCYPAHSPFKVFYESAEQYLKELIKEPVARRSKILQMWSEVHGLAGLLCHNVLQTDDNLDSLIEDMLLSARRFHLPQF